MGVTQAHGRPLSQAMVKRLDGHVWTEDVTQTKYRKENSQVNSDSLLSPM